MVVIAIGEQQSAGGVSATASSFSSLAGDSATSYFSPYHFSTFLALETPVTIIPRFSMPAIPTLSNSTRNSSFGPFSALYPVEVPLYLALYFRLTGTCTITLPSYLRRRFLRKVLQQEKMDHHNFQPLPFYFFEVAKKLLDVADQVRSGWEGEEHGMTGGRRGIAGATLQDALDDEEDDEDDDDEGGGGRSNVWSSEYLTEVGRLVQDILLSRQQKLQKSMGIFEPSDSPLFIPGIKLTNLVAHEIEFLRHSFAVVLQQTAHLDHQRRAPIEIRRHVSSAPRHSGESSEFSFSTAPVRRSHLNPQRGAVDSGSSIVPWGNTTSTASSTSPPLLYGSTAGGRTSVTSPLHTGYSPYAPSRSSVSSLQGAKVSGSETEGVSMRYSSTPQSISGMSLTTVAGVSGVSAISPEMGTSVHSLPSSYLGTSDEENYTRVQGGLSLPPQNQAVPATPPLVPPSSFLPSSSTPMPQRKRRILRQN